MTEKLQIKGKDIWVMIEPHAIQLPSENPREYFTASYHSVEPATDNGGILFLDDDKEPVTFSSPVEALEYANEKLLGLV